MCVNNSSPVDCLKRIHLIVSTQPFAVVLGIKVFRNWGNIWHVLVFDDCVIMRMSL